MMYDSFVSDVLDSFFNDSFDSLFGRSYKAPRAVKSICESSFPSSNIEVNKDTKQFRITVCLPGISYDNVKLRREDNVLHLYVNGSTEDMSDWRTLQLGFEEMPKHAELSWKIDTSKYDLDKTKVDLTDGLLTIIIDPTEAAKPKTIDVFGKLSLEDNSKKKKIANKSNDESETED